MKKIVVGFVVYVENVLKIVNDFSIEFADTPWKRSADSGRIAFIARWPITLALWLTIPDCRKYPKLRMLTFFMCIFWIGLTSYFVAFLITVVGKCEAMYFVCIWY